MEPGTESFTISEGLLSKICEKLKTPEPKNEGRSDSPVFGLSNPKEQPKPIKKFSGSYSPLTEHKNQLTKSDDLLLKEILKRTAEETQSIYSQHGAGEDKSRDNKRKENLIKMEAVNMMTKYQLVLLKVDVSIQRVAGIFKSRYKLETLRAFRRIHLYSSEKKAAVQAKSIKLLKALKSRLEPVAHIRRKREVNLLSHAFGVIAQHSKWIAEKKRLNEEIESFKSETLKKVSKKLEEQGEVLKKIDECDTFAREFKLREAQYQLILAEREKALGDIESEVRGKATVQSKALSGGNDTYKRLSLLEQRKAELEEENRSLKHRHSLTSRNFSSFVKEFNDMLDNHESDLTLVSGEKINTNHSRAEKDAEILKGPSRGTSLNNIYNNINSNLPYGNQNQNSSNGGNKSFAEGKLKTKPDVGLSKGGGGTSSHQNFKKMFL